MIDPKDYIITPDTEITIEYCEPEDVIYHGEPLTEERINEIVDRVHRNLVPGGKSLSGGSKHSPVVQVRLAEDTRDELAARAKARGVSVSKYAREIIEQALRPAS
jgi:predicted HicB family RNase H-like nuclease